MGDGSINHLVLHFASPEFCMITPKLGLWLVMLGHAALYAKYKSDNVGFAVLPSRKSDQEILKSDFYQTIFLPKIRPKADPNPLF